MSFTPEEKIKIKEMAKALDKQKEVWKQDKIEVFEQLLKLKPFIEWSKDNIIINRDVDHLNREIKISVIYKGEYEGNKTSLQRLEEIESLLTEENNMSKEELTKQVLDIIHFDETKHVLEEEDGSTTNQNRSI